MSGWSKDDWFLIWIVALIIMAMAMLAIMESNSPPPIYPIFFFNRPVK